MPNKNYLAGRRFEWKVRDVMKTLGYRTVFRTAGSKGPVDLIGVRPGSSIAFVQCKNRPPTKRERDAITAWAIELDGIREAVVWIAWSPGERGAPVMWELIRPLRS